MENTTKESRFNTFKMKVSETTTNVRRWFIDHSSEIKTGVYVAGAAFAIGLFEGYKKCDQQERTFRLINDINCEESESEEESYTETEPEESIEG